MSADTHATHGDHGHDEAGHGTMRDYVIGFAASVVLTVIPFWLVMADPIGNPPVTALLIMQLGILQILVHMFYFLHMNTTSQGGWIMMSAIFTGVIVVITLLGSMWVMYHLNNHMMPMSPEEMQQHMRHAP
jgi:cytochrome o ubiquinol oxidase operon protein cyoD